MTRLLADTGGDRRDALMWAAVALGSVANHNLSRPEMLAYASTVELMLRRVIALDQASPPSRPDYAALPHIAYCMLQTAVGAQFGGKPDEARGHFETALKRLALYGARGQLHAATRGPVGLGENEGNLMSRLQQARQCLCGEIGRAGED